MSKDSLKMCFIADQLPHTLITRTHCVLVVLCLLYIDSKLCVSEHVCKELWGWDTLAKRPMCHIMCWHHTRVFHSVLTTNTWYWLNQYGAGEDMVEYEFAARGWRFLGWATGVGCLFIYWHCTLEPFFPRVLMRCLLSLFPGTLIIKLEGCHAYKLMCGLTL